MEMNPCKGQIFNVRIEGDYLISFGFYYSTSSVSSAADYQHSQAWAVPAWAVRADSQQQKIRYLCCSFYLIYVLREPTFLSMHYLWIRQQ